MQRAASGSMKATVAPTSDYMRLGRTSPWSTSAMPSLTRWAAMARASVATLLSALVLLAGCADDDGAEPSPEPVASAQPMEAIVAFQGSGTLTGVGAATSPANPQGCNVLEEEGVDVRHHEWEIVGDVNGTAADIVRIEVTLTLAQATLLDADLYLESPDGDILAEAIAFNPTAGASETVLVEDTLEPGTYMVIVRACAGQGAYELEGEALLRTPVPPEPVGNATTGTFSATVTLGPTPSG